MIEGGRAAEPSEGVALAIVYDTSGSMRQSVRDANGQLTPKNVIASRALDAVLDRLQVVAAAPNTSRGPIDVGLVVFEGNHAIMPVKCDRFNPQAIRNWVKLHGQPKRGTPLGDAVR